jgi:cysteine desulfurase
VSSLKFPIYLDNHATTPVDPRVVEAMLPYFTEHFGNAASRHHEYGWRAEAAVEKARRQVASLIGAEPHEIVFTSGATESINLALKGWALASRGKGMHMVTAVTEHHAGLDTCHVLERAGWSVTYLPVDGRGQVSIDALQDSIRPDTVLVSIMSANNEIGTIAPLSEIGGICRRHGILFHTDAAQAAGKIPLDVRALGVDFLSLSAHKMYGPKGVGALYVRSTSGRYPLVPQIDGGGQEYGLRSGTLNVPGIVGLGVAAELSLKEMTQEAARTGALRNRLAEGLRNNVPNIRFNGDPVQHLPNNLSVTLNGVHAEALMMEMKDIAVSAGSACGSSRAQGSHVLLATGLSEAEAASTLRFGVGRFTNEEEIDYVVERVTEAVIQTTSQTAHT